jgi:dihydrofolate synthase / folylpolyglutamate synthase
MSRSFTLTNPQIPSASASLEIWLDYFSQHYHQRIELGVERITQVARALSLDQPPAAQVFTVGGTNGKGTTCCTLEAILLAAGYRVGVYSSPHLLCYTERVRIQGAEPPQSAYTAAFSLIEHTRVWMGVALTFFEYTTLVALQLFREAALEVVILEIGLGGRLDAVNVIEADIAVITTIALDHTDWLGPDRESIGYEKAGIFRPQRPAVIGELAPPHSLIAQAQQLKTPLFQRGKDWFFERQQEVWHWSDQQGYLSDLPLPQVPLESAATALAALRCSPCVVDRAAVVRGVQEAWLPGRFQILQRTPYYLIIDIAHNPQAVAYLASQLLALRQREPQLGRLHAVVGMLSDKDIPGSLDEIKPQVDEWYCAPIVGEGERQGPVKRLLEWLPPTAHSFESVRRAWQQAMQCAQPNEIVVVFGSFHTVAPVLQALESSGFLKNRA